MSRLLKIGILRCHNQNEEFQKLFGEYETIHIGLLRRGIDLWNSLHVDRPLELNTPVFNLTRGEHPDQIDSCDGYVITGSASSVYENPPFLDRLSRMIHECHKERIPVFGICFGHQAIANAFGGEVTKNPVGWELSQSRISLTPSGRQLLQDVPLPTNMHCHADEDHRSTLSLYQSHRDHVSRLPPNFDCLGSNVHTPVQMMADPSRTIISVQGHPDFTEEVMECVLDSKKSLVAEDILSEARQRVRNPTDRDLIAIFLIKFFLSLHNIPPSA